VTFAVGSLVRARGREWVVLPQSEPDLLMLRPLGGSEEEVTGIYVPLEPVEHARFALPDPARLGDFRSCRLLRDALRLGFRSSAGPFRSFAHLAIEPRPYQLVPLLMALKLDPIRILIADDVGIGKTVEAALIARELLDRGEVTRLAVLCELDALYFHLYGIARDDVDYIMDTFPITRRKEEQQFGEYALRVTAVFIPMASRISWSLAIATVW